MNSNSTTTDKDQDYTRQHYYDTISLALTDVDFLKQNIYLEGKDVFEDASCEWLWDAIKTHYKKYEELPTVAILAKEVQNCPAVGVAC
jgi:hypothetical protein